jgi:hypothetical protein
MSKHTPGPWRHLTRGRSHRISADTCGICEIPNDDSLMTRDLNERHANAVLIAAAPRMLAALEMALKYLENPEVQAIPFVLSASVPAKRVSKAIALAHGKEPRA